MAVLTSLIADQLIAAQGTDIVIPNIYTSIEDHAFSYNQLTSVVIPDGVTSIGYDAFRSNQLTSVVIPDGVTSIGPGAFYDNQLASIVIPDGVTSIEDYAFSDNQLTSVVIPDGVTSIGQAAFYDNQLTSVVIPDGVTSIGQAAFIGNPLESVSISADTPFPVYVFPEEDLIDYRGVDQSPVDISSSSSTFEENIPSGSAVATLSTTDPDAGDTHTYSLISGAGYSDNSAFTIYGDQLKINESPDYETQDSYSVLLRTTDSDGLTFVKSFTLIVNDLDETPTPTPEPTPTPVPTPTPEPSDVDAVDEIESIDDITKPDIISTFELKEPIQINGRNIETVILGTNKKDKITGSSEGEILAGGEGKDVLKGGGGPDGFLFQDPDGFGRKEADKVKDFDPDEGDSVLLDKDVFDLVKRIKLNTVTGKKAVKNATDSKKDFIYDDKKGLLYFNENGEEKGWGDGGLFVKLKGAPELDASDFIIV